MLSSLVLALFLVPSLQGQTGGLDAPQPVAPYFNGAFPVTAPGEATGWTTENAFPNLTFVDPLWLTEVPGTSDLLVVGKNGQLWRFANNPAVTQAQVVKVLEWVSKTQSSEDQGFYSLVFHPQFGQSGSPHANEVFVCYSHRPALSGADANHSFWRVSRFTWLPASGTIDPASEFVLINQYDRCRWHNGGAMFFDNEGFLNVTCGDGGDSGEGGGLTGPDGALSRTQRLDFGLFSGVFRLDVDNDPTKSHAIRRQPQSPTNKPAGWPESSTQGYGIPNTNPWLDPGGSILEEYASLGLRSPHTAHFDPTTGDVWVGDVGEGTREEITRLPRGGNAQWGYQEGDVGGPAAKPANLIGTDTLPVYDYGRSTGSCIIGGMRYRGAKWSVPLGGKLLFGDHVRGRIWSATLDNAGGAPVVQELVGGFPTGDKAGLGNFCTDSAGEVYLMTLAGTNLPGGTIRKLVSEGISAEPPALLSQTGVFTDLTTLATAPGVIPYEVANPLWSDGAAKRRWIILPNDGSHDSAAEQIGFSENGPWSFPAGTVFVKHFEIPLDVRQPGVVRRLETRFIVCTADGGKYGVTYKWNAAGTDAQLLSSGLTEDYQIVLADGASETRHWEFPARADCLLCHNAAAGQALGVRTAPLNEPITYPSTGRRANQLATFNALGMFDRTLTAAELENFIESRALDDTTAPLEHRVLSYLDANCSHCHRAGGTVNFFDARLATPLSKQGLIDGLIQGHYSLGPDGRYLKPGDPDLSAIHVRMANVGNGAAMPPLAKNVVDQKAVDLVKSYIQGLNPAEFQSSASPQARYVRLTALSEVQARAWTSVGEFSVLDGAGSPIPISELSIADVDSEETQDEMAPASRIIDGNIDTYWHTEWGSPEPPPPHHVTIDLGSLRSIGGYVYTPRQNSSNGRIGIYQIDYSVDGATWQAMDSGAWSDGTDPVRFEGLVGQRPARCQIAGPTGTVGGPFEATITLDMDVEDFTASSLHVEGGAVAHLRGKGHYYVATISPAAAQVKVSVPANVVNAAGLGNRASQTLTLGFIDTLPPVPRFTNVPAGVNRTFSVTLGFGEAVTGLDAGDLSVVNGTLSSIVPAGMNYQVTLVPSGSGPVEIALRAGAVVDLAGNPMGAGLSVIVPYQPYILAREAEEGVLSGGFVRGTDPAASGGSCIWVPQNSRGGNLAFNSTIRSAYDFILPRSGDYYVRGLVRSDDASSDSFYVGFDSSSNPFVWHTNQIGGQVGSLQFFWENANDSRQPVTGPLIFTLAAGSHTLELYGRDDGTRIDRLQLQPLRPFPTFSGPAVAAGDSFTATLSFTETVTGLTAGEIAVSGGHVISLSGGGSLYTLQIAAEAPAVTLSLPADAVASGAGDGNDASDPFVVIHRSAYEQWALDYGVDGSPAGWLADADRDGVGNLLEFAFGLDPRVADYHRESGNPPTGLPRMAVVATPEGPRLSLIYLRRKGVAGLTYTAQFGGTLGDFADAAGSPSIEPINDKWERVTVPDPTGGTPRFGRVKVTMEP